MELKLKLNKIPRNRTIVPPCTSNRPKPPKHDTEKNAFDYALLAVDEKPVQDTSTKVVINDKDRH